VLVILIAEEVAVLEGVLVDLEVGLVVLEPQIKDIVVGLRQATKEAVGVVLGRPEIQTELKKEETGLLLLSQDLL
jgi:hypothetical protein